MRGRKNKGEDESLPQVTGSTPVGLAFLYSVSHTPINSLGRLTVSKSCHH